MREILFRGKRKDNSEMVEGYYAGYDLICPNEPEDTYNATGDYYGQTPYVGFVEVDPSTVGQFTGLTDKNGKRIFEGDILLVKTTLDSVKEETRNDEYITQGVVVFNEGHFELEGKGLVLCTYWGLKSLFAAVRFKEHEVIGNIHDNPELLEG